MEGLINIFKNKYFHIPFLTSNLILGHLGGHLGGSTKCEKIMTKALSIHDKMALVSGI